MKAARESKLSVPALGAVFLVLVVLAIAYLVFAISVWLSLTVHGGSLAQAVARVRANLLALTLTNAMALGIALWMGLRWFADEISPTESLSLYPIRARTAAMCLMGGACLQFPLTELSNLLHHHVLGMDSLERQLATQQLIEAPSLGRGVLVVLCVVAAVPLMEELFFRGFVLLGLRSRYGDAAALLVSACLFGVIHIEAVPVVYATVAGLVLGVLALRTRSVWPGIAVHAAVNAMPVLIPERVFPLRGFNVPSVAPSHLPAGLVLCALVLGLALLAWASKVEYGEPR